MINGAATAVKHLPETLKRAVDAYAFYPVKKLFASREKIHQKAHGYQHTQNFKFGVFGMRDSYLVKKAEAKEVMPRRKNKDVPVKQRKRPKGPSPRSDNALVYAPSAAIGMSVATKVETSRRLKGVDLVANIRSSTVSGTNLLSFRFSPSALSGTRLALIAGTWEKYRVSSLYFSITPSVGTNTAGSVIYYVDYDVLDPPPTLADAARTAASHQGSVEASLYVPVPSLSGKQNKRAQNMLYTQDNFGRTADLAYYCTFNAVQNIASASAVDFASVRVHYDLEFFDAVNESTLSQPRYASYVYTPATTFSFWDPTATTNGGLALGPEVGSTMSLACGNNAFPEGTSADFSLSVTSSRIGIRSNRRVGVFRFQFFEIAATGTYTLTPTALGSFTSVLGGSQVGSPNLTPPAATATSSSYTSTVLRFPNVGATVAFGRTGPTASGTAYGNLLVVQVPDGLISNVGEEEKKESFTLKSDLSSVSTEDEPYEEVEIPKQKKSLTTSTTAAAFKQLGPAIPSAGLRCGKT